MREKISLILPCLNEEKGLSKLLPSTPEFIDQVLIVDGDSTDQTVKIAKKYGTDVIVEKKKGYGLALRKGFNCAKNEILVTLDGDGTYPVAEIANMYKYFLQHKVDFLVACRFPLKHKNSMTIKNFFGNLFISSITSLLFNAYVTDICSGMWIMKKSTWLKLRNKIKNNGWFFSNEIKIELLKNKQLKYKEYWIPLNIRRGKTKVGNVWLIGLQVLFRTIAKRFLS